MTILGMDVSHFQGAIAWADVPHDYRFVYAKATQGIGYTDAQYAANAAGALKSGRYVGAYHFGDLTGSPVAQAQHFATVIGRPGSGHLPPVLDLEGPLLGRFNPPVTSGRRPDPVGAASWIRAFTSTVDGLTGRKCALYMSDSTVDFLGSGWASLSAGRLVWLARIGAAPAHPCHVWQSNWYGRVAGIAGDVDVDQFNGTAAQLAAWAHATPIPAHVIPKGRTLKLTTPYMHGSDVLAVQRALARRGYHITADSVYGPNSAAAVAAFKRTIRWLPHNNIVGAGTRKALGL